MLCANASGHDERLLYVVEYAAKMTNTSNTKDKIAHLFGVLLINESFFGVEML
jgi:hypothetical protein